jgi:hypothetical protein
VIQLARETLTLVRQNPMVIKDGCGGRGRSANGPQNTSGQFGITPEDETHHTFRYSRGITLSWHARRLNSIEQFPAHAWYRLERF